MKEQLLEMHSQLSTAIDRLWKLVNKHDVMDPNYNLWIRLTKIRSNVESMIRELEEVERHPLGGANKHEPVA